MLKYRIILLSILLLGLSACSTTNRKIELTGLQFALRNTLVWNVIEPQAFEPNKNQYKHNKDGIGKSPHSLKIAISKKLIDATLPSHPDNITWNALRIELNNYYGSRPIIFIKTPEDMKYLKTALSKFHDWAKLPLEQREQSKYSINEYLASFGIGDKLNSKFAKENTWYVTNENHTKEPLLIFTKDYKNSTLPTEIMALKASESEKLLSLTEQTFNIISSPNATASNEEVQTIQVIFKDVERDYYY